jgi:hypothetical protein
MYNSKLIEVLKTFSKEELKEFEKFLYSPFFKRQRNLIPFFKILKQAFPGFKSVFLEKKNLHKKLYPGEEYNDQVMRTLASEMLKRAEDYLVQLRLRKNSNLYNRLLLHEFFLRNLNNLFEIKLKQSEKAVTDKPPFDEQTIFDLYEIDNNKINFYLGKNDYDIYCKSYFDYSDHFTVLSLLKLIKSKDQFVLYSRDYNINFEENLVDIFFENVNFDEVLEKAHRISHPYYQHLKIFYLLHKIHIDYSEDVYLEVKKEFLNTIKKFGHEEKYHIFAQLEIFCINKIHSGNRNFYKDLFDVYDLMIKNDAYTLTPDDNINAMTFRNILITAIKINNSEWLKNFIDSFSSKLSDEWKDNMRYYSYSYYYFEMGDFIRALENINKVQYELFTFKADVKNLMLKIYYELDYFEQALSTIDSYRHYITSNNVMSDSIRDYYRGFVRIYNELLRSKMNKTGFEKELLLRSEGAYPEKDWLIKKADELQ